MKTIMCSLCLFFILLVSAADAADDWTKKTITTKPSARYSHAMAYIGDDKVLLFGGWDASGRDDETWVYDLSLNTWTQYLSGEEETKPSARQSHAIAYIGDDQVLLFGGDDGAFDDETWVYDLSLNTWTNKNPTTKPSARSHHVMAYIGGDQALLFGGYDASGTDTETWVYDLSANN